MEFVEQLKSSIDIVRVVGEYVRLKRLGATGRYLGLCPFHQEKTPSFNVNQSKQFYKCFGCGVGGDAIKFVMEVDGLSFPEALKILADRNGIPMPQRHEFHDAESRLRGALHEMHVLAADFYHAALMGPQGADARAYLTKRGVVPALIETFQLGFSDPSGQQLTRKLQEAKYTPEQLEASGLVRRRAEGGQGFYDAFRGRLMFPIHNESGKVIAFGGRAMKDDEQPKYLNSPETPIYKKTSTLYNFHRARDGMRKTGHAVLVEGYMDVIGIWAAGVTECLASCGTALTNPQVRAMHRHTDNVVVNFDPDNAGANAAERAIQLLLDEGLRVKVVALEGGLDPDDYVKQNGAEAYRAKIASASGYFHWLADRARAKFDMRSAEGRIDALKFLMPAILKVPDKLERAAVANDVAGYLGVDPSLVLDQFKRSAAERRPASVPSAPKRPSVPHLEIILINALISSADVRQEILPQLDARLIKGLVTEEILEMIRGLSINADANGEAIVGPAGIFAAVEARVTDTGRTLLHEITAADEMTEDAEYRNRAFSCLKRLKEDFRRGQIDEIRARVKSAERAGNVEEALAWLKELSRLETAGE